MWLWTVLSCLVYDLQTGEKTNGYVVIETPISFSLPSVVNKLGFTFFKQKNKSRLGASGKCSA